MKHKSKLRAIGTENIASQLGSEESRHQARNKKKSHASVSIGC